MRAIDYQVKAPRAETPKAVLLIDMVGHDDATRWRAGSAHAARACSSATPNTVLFEARDAAEARRFWADRKKLGAIAARTNAFKLNEDVVLPLAAAGRVRALRATRLNVAEERYASSRSWSARRRPHRRGARRRPSGWPGKTAGRAGQLCAQARADLASGRTRPSSASLARR